MGSPCTSMKTTVLSEDFFWNKLFNAGQQEKRAKTAISPIKNISTFQTRIFHHILHVSRDLILQDPPLRNSHLWIFFTNLPISPIPKQLFQKMIFQHKYHLQFTQSHLKIFYLRKIIYKATEIKLELLLTAIFLINSYCHQNPYQKRTFFHLFHQVLNQHFSIQFLHQNLHFPRQHIKNQQLQI